MYPEKTVQYLPACNPSVPPSLWYNLIVISSPALKVTIPETAPPFPLLAETAQVSFTQFSGTVQPETLISTSPLYHHLQKQH